MMRIATAFQESANPVIWLRAVLMDLGFAGLIEEIEKRFGKFVTTFVIGCLLVGTVVWVFRNAIEGILAIEGMQQSGNMLHVLLALIYKLGFLALMLAGGIGWVNHKSRQAVRKMKSIVQDYLDRQGQLVERLEEFEEALRNVTTERKSGDQS